VFDISQFRSGAFIRRVLFVVEPGTPLKIFEPRTLCGLYSRAASWTFAPFVRMERIATTAALISASIGMESPPLLLACQLAPAEPYIRAQAECQ
jgi:hypothetical protein